MRVLVACEFSGIVRGAFAAKGHDAWSCDLLPTERPGQHIQGDVLEILNDGWDLMIAHPPCTYLTVTGNKWFKPEYRDRFPDREKQREDAVAFFMRFANADIPKICIENPIGIMSTRWRPPDQIIQPYQFGHDVRKRTGLWLKNLPLLMPTEIVEPKIKINRNGHSASVWHDTTLGLPHEQRGRERSRTFPGIAAAMADQWG